MSDHFYPADNRKGLRKLRDLRPNLFKAFLEFDAKVFEEGALSVKTKELIAVATAHITQCPWCIDAHARRARKAGASDAEIGEVIFVSMALAAGAAWSHGGLTLQCLDEHQKM